jgi:DNA-binding MarR family transcriptional regulator
LSSIQEDCARELLDIVPLVIRSIRKEIRQHRAEGLSVPQFRTLLFLRRNPGASLIDVADHLWLTPPSVSKLVDGLLARNLLTRQYCANDRRRIAMHLTDNGQQDLDYAIDATIESLTNRISSLCSGEIDTLMQALYILKDAFPEVETTSERKQCNKLPQ